jgi:type IV secretory pathway VirB4 component
MPNATVSTTQEHLDVLDIKDDVVLLKNGTACAVLQTTAVNFDLLSEIEQDAIIAAFSMLLNSITFPLQVVLRSKKLDISKYIEKVEKVESKITDPLLKYQMESYRKFVQEFITENEVLDKRFYIIIPSVGSGGEAPGSGPFDWIGKLMGKHKKVVTVNVEKTLAEAKVQLEPKVDHMRKEFNRLGIKATVLTTQELVELYFDIYNPSSAHGQRIRTNINDYTTAIVNPAIIEE